LTKEEILQDNLIIPIPYSDGVKVISGFYGNEVLFIAFADADVTGISKSISLENLRPFSVFISSSVVT
jgi:hypothetical protein